MLLQCVIAAMTAAIKIVSYDNHEICRSRSCAALSININWSMIPCLARLVHSHGCSKWHKNSQMIHLRPAAKLILVFLCKHLAACCNVQNMTNTRYRKPDSATKIQEMKEKLGNINLQICILPICCKQKW